MEIEGAVTQDVESAATETTPTPEPTGESVAATPATPSPAPARSGTENAIPHWRVEEMRKRDREELAQLRQQMQQYQGVLDKVNNGFTAFGKGLGFIQDEKPEYVDKRTYQEQLQSLEQKLSNQYRQELAVRELQSAWKQTEAKHSKWAKVPGFREACLNQYAEQTNRDLSEIADDVAGQYAKMFAMAQAEAEQAKVAEMQKTKVVKPGGGAGSPVPAAEKGNIAGKIMARLKDR